MSASEPEVNLAPGQMVPAAQYAARRRWSVGHVANLRGEGRGIPYVKIGNRIFYRAEDILAEEQENLIVPGAAP